MPPLSPPAKAETNTSGPSADAVGANKVAIALRSKRLAKRNRIRFMRRSVMTHRVTADADPADFIHPSAFYADGTPSGTWHPSVSRLRGQIRSQRPVFPVRNGERRA